MWEPNAKEEDARRRSVYIFQRRSLPLPMMAAFDATAIQRIVRAAQFDDDAAAGARADERRSDARRIGAACEADRREAGQTDRAARSTRHFELILSREPSRGRTDQVLEAGNLVESICRVLLKLERISVRGVER